MATLSAIRGGNTLCEEGVVLSAVSKCPRRVHEQFRSSEHIEPDCHRIMTKNTADVLLNVGTFEMLPPTAKGAAKSERIQFVGLGQVEPQQLSCEAEAMEGAEEAKPPISSRGGAGRSDESQQGKSQLRSGRKVSRRELACRIPKVYGEFVPRTG
jgi:hypothetical protein